MVWHAASGSNNSISASEKSNDKKLLIFAFSRGFAASTVCSPTTAGMGLMLQLSGTEWHLFPPFALFLGVLTGTVGFVTSIMEQRKKYRVKPAQVNK
ncbi:MAG: hypothetical protein ACYCV0_12465 [Desulfitobacteriaceae bacterium]